MIIIAVVTFVDVLLLLLVINAYLQAFFYTLRLLIRSSQREVSLLLASSLFLYYRLHSWVFEAYPLLHGVVCDIPIRPESEISHQSQIDLRRMRLLLELAPCDIMPCSNYSRRLVYCNWIFLTRPLAQIEVLGGAKLHSRPAENSSGIFDRPTIGKASVFLTGFQVIKLSKR